MSRHFFIDAYNVIRSSDRLSLGPLDQQREKLLSFVEYVLASGSSRTAATIVFDGKPGRFLPRPRPRIRIIFSVDKDADTILKNLIDDLRYPQTAVVVTNDRAIQKWVRGAKASVLSCKEFLSIKKKTSPAQPSDKIDPMAANTITKDLEKIWLKKK
ncbi:hypothetical protein BVX98_01175 [bacterium F11]|nr:hypothetical protein BVX98_01175 [bacterium F11]